MPQVVKLSDSIVNAARKAAELSHRSMAAQIEHWATLGRALEGSLTVDESTALKQGVLEPSAPQYVSTGALEPVRAKLLDLLARATSPAFQHRVRGDLAAAGRPLFGVDEAHPGQLVRHNPDGTLTPGRLEGRDFIPAGSTPSDQRSVLVGKPHLATAKGGPVRAARRSRR